MSITDQELADLAGCPVESLRRESLRDLYTRCIRHTMSIPARGEGRCRIGMELLLEPGEDPEPFWASMAVALRARNDADTTYRDSASRARNDDMP